MTGQSSIDRRSRGRCEGLKLTHQNSSYHHHHHQGAAALGLRSKDFVVLAALKRSANELSSYQKKIFKVDDHIGIAISGLTADARSLAKCVVGWAGLGRGCLWG